MSDDTPRNPAPFARGDRVRCIKPTRLKGPIVGREYTVFYPAHSWEGEVIGLADFANTYFEASCFEPVSPRLVSELIYLATPYSHPDPAVREFRFQAAARAAAVLMHRGRFVFSPIAHTHPIALHGLPLGWDFWSRYDRVILSRCTELIVLELDGWRESLGVQGELSIAEEFGLPVSFLKPEMVVLG